VQLERPRSGTRIGGLLACRSAGGTGCPGRQPLLFTAQGAFASSPEPAQARPRAAQTALAQLKQQGLLPRQLLKVACKTSRSVRALACCRIAQSLCRPELECCWQKASLEDGPAQVRWCQPAGVSWRARPLLLLMPTHLCRDLERLIENPGALARSPVDPGMMPIWEWFYRHYSSSNAAGAHSGGGSCCWWVSTTVAGPPAELARSWDEAVQAGVSGYKRSVRTRPRKVWQTYAPMAQLQLCCGVVS